MDKIRKMRILLLVCLYLSGCGSPDKNQQGEVQHVEAAQDKRQGTRAGRQAEDAAVQRGGTPSAQTGWEGREEYRQGGSAEEDSKDGYQVEFLGDTDCRIQSCQIYHGDGLRDVAPDEMKSFAQMLSGFVEEAKDDWGYILGILDLKDLGELGDLAKEGPEKYYILLQFADVDAGLEFGSVFGKTERMRLNGSVYIFELDTATGDYMLHYESGCSKYISFSPIGELQNMERVEGFLQEYKEWERAGD